MNADAAVDALEQAQEIAVLGVTPPRSRSFWPVYMLGLLALIGAVGGMWAASRFGAGAWANTDGLITQFEVSRLTSYASGSGGVDTMRLSYRYEVDGATYVGTRVGCDGSNDLNWTSAADANRNFAVDTPVRVYYKSADPTISCLEQRLISERTARNVGVLVVALLAAIVLLRLGRALSV